MHALLMHDRVERGWGDGVRGGQRVRARLLCCWTWRVDNAYGGALCPTSLVLCRACHARPPSQAEAGVASPQPPSPSAESRLARRVVCWTDGRTYVGEPCHVGEPCQNIAGRLEGAPALARGRPAVVCCIPSGAGAVLGGRQGMEARDGGGR